MFAKPFPSPNGLFSGGFPVDLQAAPTAPAAGPPATSVAMELVDAQAIAVATSMAHVEARPHLKATRRAGVCIERPGWTSKAGYAISVISGFQA